MPFLPITDRELRVASHQARTWGRRVMTTLVGLALLGFVFLVLGQWRGLLFVGRELFSALSWVGMIYALLSGPMTTADCLSRERRDGTLGLLFLTDLHSYDVVLGKMGAASLRIMLDLTAVLPVAALPMLMGGVSLMQLATVALAILNTMFLSLAVGTCASAVPRSGRSALAATLGLLALLTFGLSILGDILGIKGPTEPWFYMLSPIYGMQLCVGGLARGQQWAFGLNMTSMHAFGWVCLALAIWRTKHSWRELPLSARALRRRERLAAWRQGSAAVRLAWRRRMINRSPVAWLEGRDRLQARALAGILLAVAILGAVGHMLAPRDWPDNDWVILWAVFAHYILCLWISIQAPRRLADDKESGALELLLCTPVKPGEIVRGCMMILRRRFGRALLAVLLLDVFFAFAYLSEHGGWEGIRSTPFLDLAFCVLVVAPVQTCALARLGVYEGLMQANSLRATFVTAWLGGLLPWIGWFVFMVTLETLRRYLGTPWPSSAHGAFGTWAGVQLLVCVSCLVYADCRLRWSFRSLAARTAGMRWAWLPWRRGSFPLGPQQSDGRTQAGGGIGIVGGRL